MDEREAAVGDGYTTHMHTYVCTYMHMYTRTVGATERDEAVRDGYSIHTFDGYSIHTLCTYAYTRTVGATERVAAVRNFGH